ncbi:MAG: hypothetical protein DRH03_03215 [Deltaproteobacteria bacterium]|nr:MAG: hypothetical protein DRH03_03215 [Deltaproteobacteria bacterium]
MKNFRINMFPVTAFLLVSSCFLTLQTSLADDTPATAKPDYSIVAGTWQRTDGNYLIKVSDVHKGSRPTVEYFNPIPVHVAEAMISTQKEYIKLFIKLQDKNYEGSTCTMCYRCAEGDIKYFKQVFGKRAKIFPRGGHCGNMDYDELLHNVKFTGDFDEMNQRHVIRALVVYDVDGFSFPGDPAQP